MYLLEKHEQKCEMQITYQSDLFFMHEEADTRLVFHAKHASVESNVAVLLRLPDADALVLAVYVCDQHDLLLLLRVQ